MAKKLKCNYNVDKLKICCKTAEETWDLIASKRNGDQIQFEDLYLHIFNDGIEENNSNSSRNISVNVVFHSGEEFGTLVFFSPSKNDEGELECRAFFSCENKRLYSLFKTDENGEKYSDVIIIEHLLNYLSLEILSITQLDIARDTNTNTIKKYRSMIKDQENFDMILNGRVITNPKEKLKNYGEYFGRCREKIEKIPTLYFEQLSDRTPKIKIYNKSKEIAEESGKNYITQWNNFGKDTFYRTELSIYWRDLKKIIDDLEIDLTIPNAITKLTRPTTLAKIFDIVTPRLIRFRDRNGNVILPSAI